MEQSVEKLRRRLQFQQETSGQRVNLEEKPGWNLWQEEHEFPAGQLVSPNPGTRRSAMLSLITLFAMIPAEVGGGTGGRSWRMGSTWSRTRSNMGSRVKLRTLAESGIIKTRKRQRREDMAFTLLAQEEC